MKKTASGLPKLTLEVKTKLRRKDFGLMWSAAIEAGGVLVGDDVEIQLTLCFEQTT
jgi:polyisoprenoid-binding protein YceI